MDIWTQIHQFLNQRFWDNRLENILWCIGLLVLGLLLRRILSVFLGNLLFKLVKKETENLPLTDFLKLVRRPVQMFVTLVLVYTAFSFLKFPAEWHLAPIKQFGLRRFLLKSYQLLMIIALTWTVINFINFFMLVWARRASRTGSGINEQLIPFLKEVMKVFLVIFGFFLALGVVFNLDIASIIAGLGIGGLAVALAAKESLENLFASFTIFLDKPFVIGDTVHVGNIQGTVEKVGFRSTRIRTLDKSSLTLPNKMMVDQALDNLTQRRFRRAKFTINLSYNTPANTIKAICEDIRLTIASNDWTKSEPAQVRFSEFGESSLTILIVFFVEAVDWSDYNRIREEINFSIMQIVPAHRASFALPAHTLHIAREPAGSVLNSTY
ncbi:mechanosensitive ion channel family protein [Rhodocytophaga aerolata]|uniref:Mechanosensitive ion channel family protein n=1 Tax=Rhodocytophaga aerolata TaxID=455078 RepID=A0ABT8RC05_9BACT|nr:mechanosensitive ion channel family protein [Rhodocytophaga aerolata]MDO1448287.1 mechanosensitive ion channel family protein [Rhodocytophaga aerolata]